MKPAFVPSVLAALAASACAAAPTAPPPQSLEPPPLIRPANAAAFDTVTANADAHRILEALRAAGLKPLASDVSAVEQFGGAPGYVWRVGADWLHVHVYPSPTAAASAAAGFAQATNSRTAIIDWVAPPHLYQCGSVVALYLGHDAKAISVLNSRCQATALVQP